MKKLIFIFFIILTCINADDISDIDKLIDINITDINKTASLRSEIGKIDCFQKNDFKACHDSAILYYTVAKSTIAKSILAYNNLCKNLDGNLDSCYDSLMIQNEFSDLYGYTDENLKDDLTKICQKNHKPSCDRVNNKISDNKLLTKNEKGEEDLEIARFLFNMSYEIYNLGCQRDDYDSCMLLAWLIEQGIGDSNKKRAFEIYEKECKKGKNLTPCVAMATGYMYGDIVEKDTKKAEVMLKNLCDKNKGKACLYLAKLQNNDKDKKFYLEKSCKLKTGAGCSDLGIYYYDKKDYKKAFDLFDKQCHEAGNLDPDSCYFAAISLEEIDKEKNKEKIKYYYHESCLFGHLDACVEEKKYGNN